MDMECNQLCPMSRYAYTKYGPVMKPVDECNLIHVALSDN